MRNAKYNLFLLIALMVVLMPIGADAQRAQSAQDPNLLAAENYLKQQNYAKEMKYLKQCRSSLQRGSNATGG